MLKLFITLLFLIRIQAYLYLSIVIEDIDDYVTKIYTYKNDSKSIYFYFSGNIEEYCSFTNFNFVPNKGKLIKNAIYDFGETIYLETYDCFGNGFIKVSVLINEIIIYSRNRKFWKCHNCKGDSNNYIYDGINDRFKFHDYELLNYNTYYNFTFSINSFSELYNDLYINKFSKIL